MVLRFYPKKDTTIYERYPEKNTGLDAVLELSKIIDGSSSYSSRVLLDFDYTAISASIASRGYNPNQFDYRLKMYVTDASEVPLDYTLYCYPVSDTWSMGVGRYGNVPETTLGASWTYRNGSDDVVNIWQTGSFGATITGSWATTAGGGTWYTSSVASQSFSYTTADMNMDITPIIRSVQSGSITFKGLVLKRGDSDEQSAIELGSLKFFSKDTHTVYLPVLEALYNEATSTNTLTALDTNEEFNIVAVNLQPQYKESSTPMIRFSARYRYPVHTFATSSVFLTRYRLPAGSQYAIYSAQTDDVFVQFSDYTQLSNDGNGNFFKLHLDSFQPERYYKILLKIPYSGSSDYQVYDNNWIFKVARNQ